MITANELQREQEKIDAAVEELAKEKGLWEEGVRMPIYDGVGDAEAYLNSGLKVAWVLKEPYDEIKHGKPEGGGWPLRNIFSKDDWKNPTWQKVAYVMHGFRRGLSWNDLPWVHDKPEMIEELNSVAWINVSKMPAWTTSSNAAIGKAYWVWRDILWKQLEVYSPDVIIFGNTFQWFREDFGGFATLETNDGTGHYDAFGHYRKGTTHLLDAYHPCRKGGDYVDALIGALRKIAKRDFTSNIAGNIGLFSL